MCDWIVNKIGPIVLAMFGIACVEMPGNIVRRIYLDAIDHLGTFFYSIPELLR